MDILPDAFCKSYGSEGSVIPYLSDSHSIANYPTPWLLPLFTMRLSNPQPTEVTRVTPVNPNGPMDYKAAER